MSRKTVSLISVFVLSTVLLTAGFLFFPHTGYAVNLCVAPGGAGGCYAAIQSAIDAAADGDTVRVAQGTYLEAVTITKSINLEGGWNSDFSVQDWDTYVTTIDAQRTASVIQIHGAITVTVEGFTITGGDGSDYLGWGGGIEVYGDVVNGNANVTIAHNVITDNIGCTHNSCQSQGGGIRIGVANAVIENNTIISNTARTNIGTLSGRGGGVYAGWQSDVTLTDNTIMSNTATYSSTGYARGEGGGVYGYSDSLTMRNNTVAYNIAAMHGPGYGGGVYAGGSLYDNDIHDNIGSVDGEGYGGGVYAEYAPDVQGNTIKNNTASNAVGGGDGWGGGIYGIYLTLNDNTITGNAARQGGGVYFAEYSSTTAQANTIVGNRAMGSSCSSGSDRDGGGGIYIKNKNAKIVDNIINSNTSACMGGGIFSNAAGTNTLTGNEIISNTSQFGGGLAVYSTTVVAETNQIEENIAFVWGGGGYLLGDAHVTLNRNSVSKNTADGAWGLAAGGICIFITHDIPVTITNNFIAQNDALSGAVAGVYCGSGACRVLNNTFVDNAGIDKNALYLYDPVPSGGTNSNEVWNNLFVGHTTAITVYNGAPFIVRNGFWDNVTDISGGSDAFSVNADPLFVDRAGGDYHLTASSPMIDPSPSSISTDIDFDGDARPHGAAGNSDIGADEVYAAQTYVSANTGNDTTGDGSPGNPFATITKAISETTVGGTVYVGRGTYAECIAIPHSLQLRGGYNEAAGWSRDIAANETTIDGQNTCTAVTISGADADVTLEGFTITRGYAGWGAGVNAFDASVHIISNTIQNNHATAFGAGAIVYPAEYRQSEIINNYIFDNVSDGVFTPRSDDIPAPARTDVGLINGALVASNGLMMIANNVIFSNTVSNSTGSGLAVTDYKGVPISVFHNTIVNNGSGTGVVAYGETVDFYNNLIAGFSVGIAEPGTAINRDYNAWDNTTNFDGDLTAGPHDILGTVNFVDLAGGDLHILPGRVAGAGIDMGITTDMDGEPRPLPAGTAPDIGADEILQGEIYLPLIMKTGG